MKYGERDRERERESIHRGSLCFCLHSNVNTFPMLFSFLLSSFALSHICRVKAVKKKASLASKKHDFSEQIILLMEDVHRIQTRDTEVTNVRILFSFQDFLISNSPISFSAFSPSLPFSLPSFSFSHSHIFQSLPLTDATSV